MTSKGAGINIMTATTIWEERPNSEISKHAKLDPRKLARRFRDRNRRFKKLTVSQQRIKIIKDVISYLQTRKLRATPGTYVKLVGYDGEISPDDQVHTLTDRAPCEVCGIGSLFVSAVTLKNKFKVSDLSYGRYVDIKDGDLNNHTLRDYLRRWFNENQLQLIETAFEQSWGYAVGVSGQDSAVDFGVKYTNAKKRLLAILNNMLENNGKFVPPPI